MIKFVRNALISTAMIITPMSANAASPLSLANAPTFGSARAAASLESPNDFGSLQEILLIIGAAGAGLLAAVEWWFDHDNTPQSP